jgi:hypothetical protein
MWTTEQLAYLAGFVDGEGTIYIKKCLRKGYIDYDPRLQIVNTNKEVIDWICNLFGGKNFAKDRTKYHPTWKTSYYWYCPRNILDKLLPQLIPYLIIKKGQAILMIKFRDTFTKKTCRFVNEEVFSIRDEYMFQIRHLNNP